MRTPVAVTLSVWRALFLREALDRLFSVRAAWFWLLIEPVFHVGFLALLFTVVNLRTMGGIDMAVWVIVGLLAFFLFRRTAIQVMYAVDCNKALFAYRQVRPVDAAFVRAGLEAFLMLLITGIVFTIAGLLGHLSPPDDPLLVLAALVNLWMLGIGYGLISAVLMELVPELEHILKIVMMPLYFVSGVMFPLSAVPPPYRDLLMANPVAHGIEAARFGFASYYHVVPGLSLEYAYGFALSSIFIGLALFRRYALRLVTL